ncbi:MAG: DMT family transporter [Candidatus Zixiibacteriota bacterium]
MNRARILLLITVIVWGWTFVAARIALEFVTPTELLGLRLLLGVPLLAVVVRLKRIRFNFSAKDWRSVAIGSVIITVHFLIQITGIKYTSATNTGWIISVTPLVLAVLAFVILRERIGRAGVAGIALATIGMVSGGNLADIGWLRSLGDWLVLASAHTWAFYTIATRDLSRSRNPLAVTFAILTPSAIGVNTYMLFTSDWGRFLHLNVEATVAVLFLGIVGLGLAHWFWQEGVAALGAARAGLFLYIEPLATTALAVPLLGESFTFSVAIGGGLVLLGVFIAQQGSNKLTL